MVIRYEDAVKDPKTVFLNLCRHLDPDGVPADRFAELPVRGSSEASEVDGRVNRVPIGKLEDFNPVGRWQEWTSRRLKAFETIAGSVMKRAGYSL